MCARVSPEHKVRVVTALQANGEIVAMTGDGVNDAPALKRADIGVAMGITGTEVTKEAGDMVLADDNFATIVAAVRRGRAIYDNILSFVRFQLTTNMAAIGSILFARLLGLPTPFTAIQVLFVNIIADGPPAVSLGVDPPKPGLMDRPPRSPDAAILNRSRLARIVVGAAVMTALTLLVLVQGEDRVGTDVALTMTFTTFVFLQMANALAVRVGGGTVASSHSLTNRFLWLALATVVRGAGGGGRGGLPPGHLRHRGARARRSGRPAWAWPWPTCWWTSSAASASGPWPGGGGRPPRLPRVPGTDAGPPRRTTNDDGGTSCAPPS